MHNEYLEILGLKPGATKEQVKKAYRKLSKVYHPDISKDENAKDKFIEINEAYNFLTTVGPRPHQETINYNYSPKESEYDRWRREARARARKYAREQERLQQELIRNVLKTFDWVAVAIVGFNLILILDYQLPKDIVSEPIQEAITIMNDKGYHRHDILKFDGFSMIFESGEVSAIDMEVPAQVLKTKILSYPMAAKLSVGGRVAVHEEYYGLFAVFGFIIPIVMLVAYLYKFTMKTLDTKLTLAIFMVILFLIQFSLLF